MEEIGRQLRAAREALGISIEQAEEETKIRRKYIEALETGTKSDLPGEVYLKGFLRTYGNYLGLDGPGLVEEYKLAAAPRRATPATPGVAAAQQPAGDPEPVDSPAERARQLTRRERPAEGQSDRPSDRPNRRPADPAEIKPAVIRTGSSTLRTRKDGTPRPQRRRSGLPRGAIVAVVAVVVLGGLGYLGWKVLGQFSKSPAPTTQQQQAPTQPTNTTPPAQTTPTPPAQTTPAPEQVKVTMTKGEGDQYLFAVTAKEVVVRLEATERTWVQAMAGDKVLFDGYPTAPQEFRGSNLRVRLGHMVGVTLYINGQKYDTGLKSGPYTFVFSGQS